MHHCRQIYHQNKGEHIFYIKLQLLVHHLYGCNIHNKCKNQYQSHSPAVNFKLTITTFKINIQKEFNIEQVKLIIESRNVKY